jgi:hypothetical protein
MKNLKIGAFMMLWIKRIIGSWVLVNYFFCFLIDKYIWQNVGQFSTAKERHFANRRNVCYR